MIKLFFESIKSKKLEYLASMTIIALVIATLVVQSSLSSSAEKQIHDLAHNLGKNMLVVPKSTDLFNFYSQQYDQSVMQDDYPNKIKSSKLGKHIRAIQPQLYGNAVVDDNPVVIVGQKIPIYDADLLRNPLPKAIIGEELSDLLEVTKGDTIIANNTELLIGFVSPSLPEGLEFAIFTDLTTAQDLLGKAGYINALRLGGCWCRTDVPALASDVENMLPGTKAITVAGVIKSQTGTIDKVKKYTKIIYTLAIMIIAGIIASLVYNQQRKQKREIGLFLAIGISPTNILSFFILVSVIITLLGSLIGFIIGYPFTKYVTGKFFDYAVPVTPGDLSIIILITVTVSLLAAFIPAWRASKFDPSIILKEQ